MSRLTIPARDAAPTGSQPILDNVHRQLGVVPNFYRLLASSPATLTAVSVFGAALGKALDVKTREKIAVAVAQTNGCDYCLSAHTYIGQNLARIAPDELARNRRGASSDPRTEAILRFAVKVAETRGKIADADLAAIKVAGLTDGEIVEVVAVVAENFLTNLLNNVAQTDIDFPPVHAVDAA